MFNTETLANLNDLRGRVLRGEHVSDEELNAALVTLAAGRAIAQAASSAKKERTKAVAVASGASLLGQMAANLRKKQEPSQ